MHKNILTVVGITILFLGTCITPTVAIIEKSVEEKTNLDYLKLTGSNISIDKRTITTDDVFYSQLPFEPEESWIFRISDANAGYRIWDEFWEICEEICSIRWWGLSLSDYDNWTSCNPGGMVFEIIFWDTLLGNPVCVYTQVCPTAVPTGQYYNGIEMYCWEVCLEPCCDLIPDGWVSIQSTFSPNECWFLWAGSDDGDHYCYHEGATNPNCDTDCAFELGWFFVFEPKIQCDSVSMNFGIIRPGTKVTGQIYVYNVGDFYSWLDWFIDTVNVPAWGTWTFSPVSGGPVSEGDCDIIDVTCISTNVTGTYNGTIIVYNAYDSTEFCEIDTSVEVTRVRSQNAFILNLFQRLPLLEKLLSFLFN